MLSLDEVLGKALRATLRYRCPRCQHIAGYKTPQGIKCWWPECRYFYPAKGIDLGGFVDVGPD